MKKLIGVTIILTSLILFIFLIYRFINGPTEGRLILYIPLFISVVLMPAYVYMTKFWASEEENKIIKDLKMENQILKKKIENKALLRKLK